MKNWIKYVTPLVATSIIGIASFAQDQKEQPSQGTNDKSQEIVIRKKSGKTEKMTIVVDGDNVTINGKPVEEFKNNDVTVFKRDRAMASAPKVRGFAAPMPPFDPENFNDMLPSNGNKAMLGVLTGKVDGGVKVTDVTKESGADKAGLKKDDIITKVDNTKVNDPQDLIEAIGNHQPGEKVTITYKRDGKESTTTATLSQNKRRPYSYNFDNRNFNFRMPEGAVPPMDNFNFNFNRRPKIGLQIQDVETGTGVTVKDVDEESPASKAGIQEGDIITQVNGKDVAGVDELRDAIKDVKEGETIRFSFKRAGKNETAEIKIPKRLKTANL